MKYMKLFEAIDIWRRKDGGAICYRCFRVVPSGQFCVQSADYYSSSGHNGARHDQQHIELFSEQDPDQRSGSFPTIEEAILNFDSEFGNG